MLVVQSDQMKVNSLSSLRVFLFTLAHSCWSVRSDEGQLLLQSQMSCRETAATVFHGKDVWMYSFGFLPHMAFCTRAMKLQFSLI